MIAQAVLTALACAQEAGGSSPERASLLGALYLVGGLGKPLDPVASDPNGVVYALLRITGLLGAIALVAAGAATVIASLRRS